MIILGVDAHKRTHTLVAIDDAGRRLGERTVAATTDGHLQALQWASCWAERRFAIEDCHHVSRRLEPMFRALVVPLDGSEFAERALPYAARLAEANRGRMILVCVATTPLSAGLEKAEPYLASVAAKLRMSLPVETRVTYGRPALSILETLDDTYADGVVMASDARTGLQRARRPARRHLVRSGRTRRAPIPHRRQSALAHLRTAVECRPRAPRAGAGHHRLPAPSCHEFGSDGSQAPRPPG